MNKTPEYIEFLKTRISHNVSPENAELMIKYALSPEEHKKALSMVSDYVFLGKTPVDNPKVFLIIAQTGGGKSTLTSKILRDNPNTILLDTDAFKAFNPYRQMLSEKYPKLYGHLTGIDAYLHRDEIYEKAIKERYNILVEIAPSTKEKLFNVDIEELEKQGYIIDANILAVSKSNSLLSIYERYECQIESKMESPKLTDFTRAIDSYNAVEMILKDLVKKPKVLISIWKRGAFMFDNNLTYVTPSVFITNDKSQALQSLIRERELDRIDTLKECNERIKAVKEQMKIRSSTPEQFEHFEMVEKIIYNNL